MKRQTMTATALLGVGALGVLAGSASAGIFAHTSFEEPEAVGGQYTDTLDPMTDHALLDNPGEPFVNYTASGGELGFSSFYTNTRDDVGLTDGDFVGVTDFAGTVGDYTDGSQGFQISDPDGLMTTTIDTVDLTGAIKPFVSLDLFVQDTGYEEDDRIRAWVEVDGGQAFDLFNAEGDAIEKLDHLGAWETFTFDLTGFSTATLHFELDANSGSEAIYVDNIFYSNIPAPGALALFAVAGLAARRRRRQ